MVSNIHNLCAVSCAVSCALCCNVSKPHCYIGHAGDTDSVMVAFRQGPSMDLNFIVGKQAEALINSRLKAPMEVQSVRLLFVAPKTILMYHIVCSLNWRTSTTLSSCTRRRSMQPSNGLNQMLQTA